MLKTIFTVTVAVFSANVVGETAIVASCTHDNLQEVATCQKQTEKKIIAAYPALFQRNGNELVLKPIKPANPPMTKINKEFTYTVVAYYPDYYISLIKVTGNDYSSAFIYHHLYGTDTVAYGEIAFSSNGRFMVAYNPDLGGIEAGFSPNATAVYTINKWPKILSTFQGMNFSVINAKFVSNNQIVLKTAFYDRNNKSGYGYGECKIMLQNSVWQFTKPEECMRIE